MGHTPDCDRDGALWIWNLADLHFPGAIQIVDLYHARQHLWAVAALLFPNQSAQRNRWIVSPQRLLDQGRIESLIKRLRTIRSENDEVAQKLSLEAEYFARNAARMRYPEFRKLGLFVGSGVVEAGCKTVIASRLKCSGMFTSSPVAAGGHLYITNEEGHSYVLALGPEYKLLAENEIGETVMATPAIADGVLYIRGGKHLFAIGDKQ
jgi:hypothetical protein